MNQPAGQPLMTPIEVATLFRVDPRTVTRWGRSGRLASIQTIGGHRRYFRAEIEAVLRGKQLTSGQVRHLRENGGHL